MRHYYSDEIGSFIKDQHEMNKVPFTELSLKLKLPYETVRNWYHNAGGIVLSDHDKNRKYRLNENYFNELTPNSAYWLGFIYADGCILKKTCLSIKLKSDDKDHLELFHKCLQTDKPVLTYNQTTRYGKSVYAASVIYSKTIFDRLSAYGIVKNKSLVLTFPSEAILPVSLQRDFIRGYFDGDGSVILVPSKKYNFIDFVGTKEFLTGLNNAIGNRGILYKEPRKPNKNIWELKITRKDDSFWMKHYLYDNAEIYLKRKFIKFVSD